MHCNEKNSQHEQEGGKKAPSVSFTDAGILHLHYSATRRLSQLLEFACGAMNLQDKGRECRMNRIKKVDWREGRWKEDGERREARAGGSVKQ